MEKVDFNDWHNSNPTPYHTIPVGSCGNICDRDCYKLSNGVHLYDHWVSPYNFLKPSYSYVVIDFNIPQTPENIKKIEEFGGIAQDWGYVEDGFVLAIFEQLIINKDSFWNKSVEEDKDAYLKRAFNYINDVLTKL